MKRIIIILIAIIVWSNLAACAEKTDELYNSFWDPESNCQPPCWLGITPGRTHQDELFSIVSDPKLFDQSFQRSGVAEKVNYYNYVLVNNQPVEILVSDQFVFAISWASPNSSLAAVLERLGKPDFVIPRRDELWYIFDFYWMETGVFISAAADPNDDEWYIVAEGAKAYPEMEVSEIAFYDPTSYQDLSDWLINVKGHRPEVAQYYSDVSQEWAGYDSLYAVSRW